MLVFSRHGSNAIDRKKEINFNCFCKILQNVFKTERKRKIIDGKKQTVYPVKWRVLDKTNDVLNTEELVQLLMTHGCVTCSDENNITLARSTGFLSNKNMIYKDVILLSEKFEVQLRGIVVDLSEYEISGEYHRSRDGILALIQQIDAIPICQGTVIKKRKYEMHKNLICERLSRENERDHFTEILRSANCRQAATLSGRSYPNCRTCQRLVVHYKEPEPTRQTLEKVKPFEPCCEKTGFLHMRKQRRRTAGR